MALRVVAHTVLQMVARLLEQVARFLETVVVVLEIGIVENFVGGRGVGNGGDPPSVGAGSDYPPLFRPVRDCAPAPGVGGTAVLWVGDAVIGVWSGSVI